MSPSVEVAGVEIAYYERGEGRAVVAIHGLASGGGAWNALADALAGEARVIAYDRRGYGGSGAPETYGATTVEEQAQDAAALIEAVGAAPALVVGDGFGALVALDLLKRRRDLVDGAVLSDPPLFAFVPLGAEELAGQRLLLEEALRDGGPEAAVEAWLGGRVEGDALERARRAHRAFFADFAGLTSWPITRRELRAIDASALVVTGPHSPPHVVAAADSLAGLLPSALRAQDGDVVVAARSMLREPEANRPSPR
jgi:pimeloyl-ACP methyl ester carboxylesterase